MAISCVYCGGSHSAAAQVRACWQRHSGREASSDSPPINGSVARRGPPELARNLITDPATPVPVDWHGVSRIAIGTEDVASPTALIGRLRQMAEARQPAVFEIDAATVTAIELGGTQRIDSAPHRLGARFTFELAELKHLVFTNSVVSGSDGLRWPLLDAAIALGANPVLGTDDGAADLGGDIVMPDGTTAWLDGGPLRFTAPINSIGVIHRISIEHRSLAELAADNRTTADLAPDQLAAVTHEGGAARIIAPAGSGKTRVLTERARHLINHWRLPPSAVCLVAFNRRAQQEMAERTSDLRGLQVRTLNAIAYAIVNGSAPFAAQPARLRVIDEGEMRRIIGGLVTFPRKRNADPVAPWIEALSMARLGLRDPEDVEALYDGDVDGFADVLPRYRAALAAASAVDFDEQIQLAIELLLRQPAVRIAAQRACQVLLVDEFQDLTPAHMLLIRLLAGPEAAVFAVGDDDQTIYGYNGADPGWLIDFATLFPGGGDHPLTVNYRCPGGIVTAADMLLRHNRRRVAKQIRAAHAGSDGLSIVDNGDPVGATVGIITTAISAGRTTSEVAVLTRVNSLLAPVQVALVAGGVPVAGGVGVEFLERTSVRAGLAWLRLAGAGGGPLSPTDLAEALRRPARPLHPNVAKWVGEQSSLEGLHRLAKRLTTERESERVDAFADDIARLQTIIGRGGTTGLVLATLRDTMGLESTVATLDVHRHGMNRASQNDDLTALAQLGRMQPDAKLFESWLRGALRTPWQPDGVTLATVHRVKGQEWPMVVVHHADIDQFPHRLADDIEEERRLFHVAITRAAEHATIVVAERPSPFIAELTTEPSATIAADDDQGVRGPMFSRGGDRTSSGAGSSASGRAARSAAPPTRPGQQLQGDDAALFEELRAVRRHLAAGKPAYTVVADATLAAIAEARPASLAELARIRGIGPSKLEQYGAALLAAVESATNSAPQ